jgi:hypothetical protein
VPGLHGDLSGRLAAGFASTLLPVRIPLAQASAFFGLAVPRPSFTRAMTRTMLARFQEERHALDCGDLADEYENHRSELGWVIEALLDRSFIDQRCRLPEVVCRQTK